MKPAPPAPRQPAVASTPRPRRLRAVAVDDESGLPPLPAMPEVPSSVSSVSSKSETAPARKAPPVPAGAKASGKRLWRSIVAQFDLAEYEVALLRELVRIVDRLDDLAAILDNEGLIAPGGAAGPKAHPALVEARQLAIAQARLTVALRVPLGDEEGAAGTGRPQRRGGARGAYQPRGRQ